MSDAPSGKPALVFKSLQKAEFRRLQANLHATRPSGLKHCLAETPVNSSSASFNSTSCLPSRGWTTWPASSGPATRSASLPSCPQRSGEFRTGSCAPAAMTIESGAPTDCALSWCGGRVTPFGSAPNESHDSNTSTDLVTVRRCSPGRIPHGDHWARVTSGCAVSGAGGAKASKSPPRREEIALRCYALPQREARSGSRRRQRQFCTFHGSVFPFAGGPSQLMLRSPGGCGTSHAVLSSGHLFAGRGQGNDICVREISRCRLRFCEGASTIPHNRRAPLPGRGGPPRRTLPAPGLIPARKRQPLRATWRLSLPCRRPFGPYGRAVSSCRSLTFPRHSLCATGWVGPRLIPSSPEEQRCIRVRPAWDSSCGAGHSARGFLHCGPSQRRHGALLVPPLSWPTPPLPVILPLRSMLTLTEL